MYSGDGGSGGCKIVLAKTKPSHVISVWVYVYIVAVGTVNAQVGHHVQGTENILGAFTGICHESTVCSGKNENVSSNGHANCFVWM